MRAGGDQQGAELPIAAPPRAGAESSRPGETRPNTLPRKIFRVSRAGAQRLGTAGVTIALYNPVAQRTVGILLIGETVLPIPLLKL